MIYSVNRNNSIISLSCNDSNVEHFRDEVKIFTNAPYEIIDKGPVIYLVFEGVLKELLVLPSDKAKKCGNIRFA